MAVYPELASNLILLLTSASLVGRIQADAAVPDKDPSNFLGI